MSETNAKTREKNFANKKESKKYLTKKNSEILHPTIVGQKGVKIYWVIRNQTKHNPSINKTGFQCLFSYILYLYFLDVNFQVNRAKKLTKNIGSRKNLSIKFKKYVLKNGWCS